jgi:predicted nucleic acid-binding protein
VADLFIAATAVANGLELYTRHPEDFVDLQRILTVVEI